jgi:DNA-binding transcriptional regulator YdaS (Cro superfamily)
MLLAVVQQAADRVGGISELARKLGIRHTAFYRWKQVPSARVLPIERATGISRHALRPDLYPPSAQWLRYQERMAS